MCTRGNMKRPGLISLTVFILAAAAGCRPTAVLKYLANQGDTSRSEAIEAAETLERLDRWTSTGGGYYWPLSAW